MPIGVPLLVFTSLVFPPFYHAAIILTFTAPDTKHLYMAFKLLALRAIDPTVYLKNLVPHQLYSFTTDYIFEGNDNKLGTFRSITSIVNKNSYPQDLFDVEMANGNMLSVHISALLGKNGSGKSSLLELLYLLVYCLAEKQGYLKERESNQPRHQERNFSDRYFKTYSRQVEQLLARTRIEVYYEIDGRFFVLTQHPDVECHELANNTWTPVPYYTAHFFYTIVVNYSLYGLNDRGPYFWLHPLFHKNDGYRTPLVLNPYRTEGVIDINAELHLAQTRLLTNLADERLEAGIPGDKEVAFLTFDIDPDRIGWVDDLTTGDIAALTMKAGGDLETIFEQYLRRYLPAHADRIQQLQKPSLDSFRSSQIKRQAQRFEFSLEDSEVEYKYISELLAEYMITKIAKICNRYEEFRNVTKEMHTGSERNRTVRVIHDNEGAVNLLIQNNSHVTLKLKQAAQAYLNGYFVGPSWKVVRNPADPNRVVYRNRVTLADFRRTIAEAIAADFEGKRDTIQYIPGAMFRPSLELVERSKNESEQAGNEAPSTFTQLSSGEQQLLHSIHCILYHLLNIDSLENPTTRYSNVNIILDEIELYYHPAYQQQFIATLRSSLQQLRLQNVRNVNIIFSTHSPFILSDIPHQNVLKLAKGRVEQHAHHERTFGSNIHEMLAKSFLLDDQLIGTFAAECIDGVITELNELEKLRIATEIQRAQALYAELRREELSTRRMLKTIDLIGERVVQQKLKEMYRMTLQPEQDDLQNAKAKIQELMDKFGLSSTDL